MTFDCANCGETFEPAVGPSAPACPACGHAVIPLPAGPTPWLGEWMRGGVSTIASILIHCVMVVALALMTNGRQGDGEAPGDEVSIGILPRQNLDDSSHDHEQLENDAKVTSPDVNEELDDLTQLTEDPLEDGDEVFVDIQTLAPSGAAGGSMSSSLANLSGSGVGSAGAGANFMGLQARGTRFCIIADHSKSMSGEPLARLKRELSVTVNQLHRNARFHVLFYSNTAKSFPKGWGEPKLMRGEFDAWLNSIDARGGTNPASAFSQAFHLKPPPDAVFFMTDGKIPFETIEFVSRCNERVKKKVPVHTISFVNRSAEIVLQRIAKNSGGKYRHVE